jgi:hypothetical protein
MNRHMGRLTKRNRAKYRRRAYEAAMLLARQRVALAGTSEDPRAA